jgi:iron(II)-dependent oxidoreductase
LDPLDDADLLRQHSPLMSPLVWDLAHVGNYEDLWLLRAVGAPGVGPQYDDMYDAFRHPRRNRPALPLLGPDAARAYIGEVRDRALAVLDSARFDGSSALLCEGFVYGMVVQHEHQHDETMLATLQLRGVPYEAARSSAAAASGVPAGEVLVEGGPFVMGTDSYPWAYDNERPAHEVDLPPFWIDTVPVRNCDYEAFMADGGYARPELWTEEGWAWRCAEGLEAPQFWERDADGSWWRTRFGWREPVPPDEPVQHVCWHEACAYARWAGKRLPTEAEWEKAAGGLPSPGLHWADRPHLLKPIRPMDGDAAAPVHPAERAQGVSANRRMDGFGPGAVGTSGPASAWGCFDLLGNVWEWTASSFLPYPGFRSFPYREYSEVFFGPDYKVLRGGSWATHPSACRPTFRNWDFPIRRQIFAGFRCARDADV